MPNDLPQTTHRASSAASLSELSESAASLAELAGALGHRELADTIRDDARRRLDDGRVRVVVLGETARQLAQAFVVDEVESWGVRIRRGVAGIGHTGNHRVRGWSCTI